MHEGNNRVHVANLFNLYPKRVHKEAYIYFYIIVYAVVVERRLPHSLFSSTHFWGQLVLVSYYFSCIDFLYVLLQRAN